MAKNKKKKKNITGVTSSIGGDYDAYRHKSKKRPRPMTAAREAVRREIREIIDAKEAKKAITRKVSTVAKNGISDLKIDGAHLMNMMKGLKMKESPSQSSSLQQPQATVVAPVAQQPVPNPSSTSQSNGRKAEPSYYDKWYDLIYTELRMSLLKEQNKI